MSSEARPFQLARLDQPEDGLDTRCFTLRERGYEPREAASGEIRLANCPFHELVGDHRELVCGMNLALADGLLDAIGDDEFARLDPQRGQCCVAIGPLEGETEKALKGLGD